MNEVRQGYFETARALHSSCEEETFERLPSLGEKAPQCYDATEKLLRVLDPVACCTWQCRELKTRMSLST